MTRKVRPERAASRKGRSPRSTPPAFSIATIVRNEEEGLPALLASISGFIARGGEVVVVDTGSNDRTVEIAKRAGCRVEEVGHRFERKLTRAEAARIERTFAKEGEGPIVAAGDRVFEIGAARNHAAALARGPCVLAVDGRDVVDALDIDAVNDALTRQAAPFFSFETRRLFRGHWLIEGRPYLQDRRAAAWHGRAHNFLMPIQRVPTGDALLPREHLRVTHHSSPSKDRSYQLTGAALDALDPVAPAKQALVFGHELALRGHVRSALQTYLGLDHDGVALALRCAALCGAADCVRRIPSPDAQERVLELYFRACQRNPAAREPWLRMARLHLVAGSFQAAVSASSAALAIPPSVGGTQLSEDLRDAPHAILYWALLWLGRRNEAREHLRVCLDLEPQNPTYQGHRRLLGL